MKYFVLTMKEKPKRSLMMESQEEARILIRKYSSRTIKEWDKLICAGKECTLHICESGYILCVEKTDEEDVLKLTERSVVTKRGSEAFREGDERWWTREDAFADARDVTTEGGMTYEEEYNKMHKLDFVEIDVNSSDNPIREYPEEARGIYVNPLKHQLERLPDRKHIARVCTAVGAESRATLFFVRTEDINANKLPNWLKRRNSIGRPNVDLVRQLRKYRRSYLYRHIDVGMCSIVDLLDDHNVMQIGLLKIHSGGQDCDILKGLISHCAELPSRWPDKILFGCDAMCNPKDVNYVVHKLSYEGNYKLVLKTDAHITMERMEKPSFANTHYGLDGVFIRLETEKTITFVPRTPAHIRTIPLHLFQFWHSQELPPHMKRITERTRAENPEFQYRLFNVISARAFIAENFHEDVVRAFDCLVPFTYKCDLLRYCVLYVHGGIYLDIKFKCVNGFRLMHMTDGPAVLDYPHLHWFEHDHIGVVAGCLAFQPKSHILKVCIDKIIENVRHKRYGFSCLYPTGPGLLGLVYEEFQPDVAFDMCLTLKNHKYVIMRGNCVVLETYNEYDAEKYKMNSLSLYYDLWVNRKVYRPWTI